MDIFIDDENNLVRFTFDTARPPAGGAADRGRSSASSRWAAGPAMTGDQITKCIETSLPPGRGHHPDRRRRRRFQAGAAISGIGTKLADWATERRNISVILLAWVSAGIDPSRNRFGDRGHHHRVFADAGLVEGMSTGRDLAGRVGGRCGIGLLLPRERRRFLVGEGVLRDERRSDHQVVVDHGDGALGHRPWCWC